MLRSRTVGIGFAVGLALLVAACGGDDDDTAAPTGGGDAGSADVAVVAEDIGFDADTYEASAGTVSFRYENDGSIVHTLKIEAVDGFGLEVASGGDVDQGSVDLDPGTYTIFCDVPGHRSAGMEAELTVS